MWSNWYVKEKQGWYTYAYKDHEDLPALYSRDKYAAMIDWIIEHVPGPYRHARWRYTIDGIQIKFRHEKDYLLFMLRWS